jgi:succinate dehydrogenase / fumarate reductase cytochrome b subunit
MSPHLQVWKWGPAMLVSILHRVTGDGMATVGLLLFAWWIAALAAGAESYAVFRDVFTYADGRLNAIGWIVAVGLTLSLFQHMMSGLRHLLMDTGAAFELRLNKTLARLTMVFSVTLTVIYWLWMGLK